MCLWLVSMDMDQYTTEFTARGVDGPQLLSLDGEKLKVSATQIVYEPKYSPFLTINRVTNNNNIKVNSDTILNLFTIW